jgi:hypothetical protein
VECGPIAAAGAAGYRANLVDLRGAFVANVVGRIRLGRYALRVGTGGAATSVWPLRRGVAS